MPNTTPDQVVGTSDDGVDIGTLLEVPEDQRLDVDPDPTDDDYEANPDEGLSLDDVPDGDVVTLSTAHLGQEA